MGPALPNPGVEKIKQEAWTGFVAADTPEDPGPGQGHKQEARSGGSRDRDINKRRGAAAAVTGT